MKPMRLGPSSRGWIAQASNFEFKFFVYGKNT